MKRDDALKRGWKIDSLTAWAPGLDPQADQPTIIVCSDSPSDGEIVLLARIAEMEGEPVSAEYEALTTSPHRTCEPLLTREAFLAELEQLPPDQPVTAAQLAQALKSV